MSGVSNHYDSMVAIKAIVDALITAGTTVQGLNSTNFNGGCVIQEVPWHEKNVSGTVLNYISISPFGNETTGDANSNEDEVGYPVMVALVMEPCASKLEERLGIREKLRRRLRNRSLSGLPRNFNVLPSSTASIDVPAWVKKQFVSGIQLTCLFEEPRT